MRLEALPEQGSAVSPPESRQSPYCPPVHRSSRICENSVNFSPRAPVAMRDRYRQIVALSRDCIKEIDLDGRITSVNLNGLVGLGASSADQILARPWRELWPPEAAAMVDAAMAAAAKGATREFEASCVNLAGVRQTWQVVTSPLFDEQGEVEAILAVSKNVSDRRALEAAFHTLDSTLTAERAFSTNALMLARTRNLAVDRAAQPARFARAHRRRPGHRARRTKGSREDRRAGAERRSGRTTAGRRGPRFEQRAAGRHIGDQSGRAARADRRPRCQAAQRCGRGASTRRGDGAAPGRFLAPLPL
ncbi:hypothetical protein XAB3213_980033 [Xanthomonas citri pv. bilvae]|nr:hypothetical protein XAB3213_980033 [Xanthomonas citri pv. bilvae]